MFGVEPDRFDHEVEFVRPVEEMPAKLLECSAFLYSLNGKSKRFRAVDPSASGSVSERNHSPQERSPSWADRTRRLGSSARHLLTVRIEQHGN